MRVAIRVDASLVIGSGHWMRCLTLAKLLQKKESAEIHFISRDLEGNLHGLARGAGFFLHILPRHRTDSSLGGYAAWLTVTQRRDAEETKALLQSLGQVDCLVVDSYAIDIFWERQMRPWTREIFVIDDLANRKHDCDVLLDQNFYLNMGKRYEGLVPPHCRMLLGPAHALLMDEFYEARRHARKRTGRLGNILVFYGGSDLTDETSKAIRALLEAGLPDLEVNVIVGGKNPQKEDIRAFCRRYASFHYHEQVSNMAEFMNEADLMLGAGGTTMWERCFLGLPAIVTAVAENQVEICRDCSAAGIIEYLGFYDEVKEEDLTRKLQVMTGDELIYMEMQCFCILSR